MLFPYPSHSLGSIVLVTSQPKLSLHANDVENLARDINQVRYAAFTAIVGNVEFEQTGSQEEYLGLFGFGRSSG